MNRIDNATIAHNMKWGMILLGALSVALFIGTTLATDTVSGVGSFFAVTLPLLWLMIGAKYWWLPVPISLIIGGTFQMGFKILPFELAVVLAVAALITALPLRWSQMLQPRKPIPFGIFLLCLYLGLSWLGSIMYNRYMDLGGFGNATRSYSYALWPVIMIMLFHLFGKSEQLMLALKLIFLLAVFRVAVGYFFTLTGIQFYIPVINYIPAGAQLGPPGQSDGGNMDFRFSGANMAIFAAFLFLLSKHPLHRFIYGATFILGSLTMLAGGGRSYMVIFAMFPVALLLLYKRYGFLLTGALAGVCVIMLLNMFPAVLDRLPGGMGRALAIFVLDENASDWHASTLSSDAFHATLEKEGFDRWTGSWNTIIFGTGIRPFNRDLYNMDLWAGGEGLQESIQNAANTGAYEAGLWSVLAVTGLVGMALYLNAFRLFAFHAFGSLWKNKICDAGHAFAFLGIYMVGTWLLTCSRAGHFPSEHLFYMYLGYVWIQDQKMKAAQEQEAASKSPAGAAGQHPHPYPGQQPGYGSPAYN